MSDTDTGQRSEDAPPEVTDPLSEGMRVRLAPPPPPAGPPHRSDRARKLGLTVGRMSQRARRELARAADRLRADATRAAGRARADALRGADGARRGAAHAVDGARHAGRAAAAGGQRLRQGIASRFAPAHGQSIASLFAPADRRGRPAALPAPPKLARWMRRRPTVRGAPSDATGRLHEEALFILALLGLAKAPDVELPRLRLRSAPRADGPASGAAMLASVVSLSGGFGAVVVVLTLVASAVSPVIARNATAAAAWELQIPDQAVLPALGERSVVYAADGSVLAVLDREVNREIIPLDQIPPHVRHAIITAEDRKFYEHPGYDVEGIARAMVANARAGDIAQGGSTITQQLAKTIVGNERTLERKATELTYAIALERELSKDELLERYLNQVYFGSRAYGVAAAAEAFFATTVEELTVPQAALLAGMVRSPGHLDPRDNPDAALARRNDVLQGMADEGYVSAEELPGLLAAPLDVAPLREGRRRVQPHFVDTVERELLASSALGDTFEEREQLLYSGGLQIHTTLDPRLQKIAAEVLAEHLPEEGPTAALAVVEPTTGRVLATHGGLDYAVEQYDLATQGRRQPGSAAKPFVYAAALSQGFPLDMTLEGASPAYFDVDGWRHPGDPLADPNDKNPGVSNYGGASYGRVNMTEALVKSVNTAAAQLMMIVGASSVADLMQQMGINVQAATDGLIVPSIALGGPRRGVTPLEMASAYSTFANEGRHAKLRVIDRVEDRRGELVYEPDATQDQVLDPAVNAVMVDLMRGVVERGTGTRARVSGWQAAGKTGTAQDNADAWFAGVTPVMSTAVWVGHAEAKIPMPGMTGGALPAVIWQDFMTRALEGIEPIPFPDVPTDLSHLVEGQEAAVPDVRKLTDTEALTALGAVKLIGDVRMVASEVRKGVVIWQTPKPGAVLRPGDRVVIGVSTGVPPPPPEPEPTPTPTPTESEAAEDGDKERNKKEKENENQAVEGNVEEKTEDVEAVADGGDGGAGANS